MAAVKTSGKAEWLDLQVRAWERRLIRYLCRFTSLQVSREIAQEGFVRLWNHGEAGLAGREREWLFCVCRNLAIDHLRKESRVSLVEEEGVFHPEAEEVISFQEEISRLQASLGQLRPSQREVVRLKYQENMTYQEISSVTGHSVSYVGVLIHQAVEKMRLQMSGKAGKASK